MRDNVVLWDTVCHGIQFVENLINSETLELFKEVGHNNDENGPFELKSLFDFWKKSTNRG